jgi:DNA primase
MRRQQQQLVQQPQPPQIDVSKPVEAGSSVEALEYELVKYLLKSGHKSYEVLEAKRVVPINIADEIFQNLDADNITFTNPVYQSMLATYREHWLELGVGVKVPEQYFVNHIDPEVCNMAVDILTSDDNYIPSTLWSKKDVHVESESEILSVGVPKAIMLYRSKVVDRLIKAQFLKLQDETMSEEERDECVKHLTRLLNVKTAISRESQRLIL